MLSASTTNLTGWDTYVVPVSFAITLIVMSLMMSSIVISPCIPMLCKFHGGSLGNAAKDPFLISLIDEKEQEILTSSHMHLTMLDILKKTGLFLLDYLTDLNTIWVFFSLKHYRFAIIMAAVYVRSFVASLGHGGVFRLIGEARKSYELGVYTDDYLALIDIEQGIEAIPALLMQFYAFPWMISDPYSNFSFVMSVGLSFKAISEVVYERYHLGVDVQELIQGGSEWTEEESDVSRSVSMREVSFSTGVE